MVIDTLDEAREEEEDKGEALVSQNDDGVEVVAEKEQMVEETKEEVDVEVEGERSPVDD